MDLIYECATKFVLLERYEYRFVVSKKRKTREMILNFHDTDFFHLAGLHYLTDISISRNRKDTLKNIIDGVYGSYMKDGVEKAIKVRIDSAIGLNEFYDRNDEFVSVKRNDGGFVHVVANIDEAENERSTFKTDMLITNVRRVEADDEKNTPEKVIIKGAIFNFRKDLLPVEYTVLNPVAMDYFEGLGASNSNPILTEVRGRQISETVTRTVTEESAFGENYVKEVPTTKKDFVITGCKKESWEWDVEGSITAAELKKAMADREVYLAGVKSRQDEYKASKGQASAAPATGGFNF